MPEEPTRWGASTTINNAIAAWRDNGWDDLSPKTARGYESTWRVHIEKSIGKRKIASLGPYDIERYYRSLKSTGLSPSTVHQVKAILHRSCRLAHKWSGGTLPNPAADAELPVWKLVERRDEVRAPEVEEVVRLVHAARDDDPRFGCFVLLLAATGMRRGEACALRWSDFDEDAGTVRVDESVVSAKGGALVKSPKTSASVRRVALDESTIEALRALRLQQEHIALSAGVEIGPHAFVFSTSADGSLPPHPDAVSHAFGRIRTKAGVAEDVHLHSLRHFHATAVDGVVSEAQKQARLGWSTIQMSRHYTDGLSAEDHRAAEHVGRLLTPATSSRSTRGS